MYSPADRGGTRAPAVVFVTGFADEGMRRIMGCSAKEMASYVSWAEVMAASGFVAVTYTNRQPAADVQRVLGYLREHSTAMGVDERRVGVWACSGNVPTALSVLMDRDTRIRCAALCYGFMLDADGSTGVAEASRTFGFANPCADKACDDLPSNLPLFIARAGRDETPALNQSIDRFLRRAVDLNLPVTFVNYPMAPHAFDIVHDTAMSRDLVRQVAAFMRLWLR
jgi:acetyl esterase/lipase